MVRERLVHIYYRLAGKRCRSQMEEIKKLSKPGIRAVNPGLIYLRQGKLDDPLLSWK